MCFVWLSILGGSTRSGETAKLEFSLLGWLVVAGKEKRDC